LDGVSSQLSAVSQNKKGPARSADPYKAWKLTAESYQLIADNYFGA